MKSNRTLIISVSALILIFLLAMFLVVTHPASPPPVARATAGDTNFTNVIVANRLNTANQTALTLTEGLTISPTGTYQPISSASAITTSTTSAIANGTATGDLLILRNVNASDAIIVDGAGGNVECGGNKTLGANDVLQLIWNGSDWSCIGNADN